MERTKNWQKERFILSEYLWLRHSIKFHQQFIQYLIEKWESFRSCISLLLIIFMFIWTYIRRFIYSRPTYSDSLCTKIDVCVEIKWILPIFTYQSEIRITIRSLYYLTEELIIFGMFAHCVWAIFDTQGERHELGF